MAKTLEELEAKLDPSLVEASKIDALVDLLEMEFGQPATTKSDSAIGELLGLDAKKRGNDASGPEVMATIARLIESLGGDYKMVAQFGDKAISINRNGKANI